MVLFRRTGTEASTLLERLLDTDAKQDPASSWGSGSQRRSPCGTIRCFHLQQAVGSTNGQACTNVGWCVAAQCSSIS